MIDMDPDKLASEISTILENVRKKKSQIESEHERFRVALAGSLRLLSGQEGKTLSNLQGDPEALKGYLISQVSELARITTEHLTNLSEELEKLVQMVR